MWRWHFYAGLFCAKGWGRYLIDVPRLTGAEARPVDWTIGGKASAFKANATLGVHAGYDGMTMQAPAVILGKVVRVIATVRSLRIAPPVPISPPKAAGAPWRVAFDAADHPLRSDVQIDGALGRLVGLIHFAKRHRIDRLVGCGIAVHEGALYRDKPSDPHPDQPCSGRSRQFVKVKPRLGLRDVRLFRSAAIMKARTKSCHSCPMTSKTTIGEREKVKIMR